MVQTCRYHRESEERDDLVIVLDVLVGFIPGGISSSPAMIGWSSARKRVLKSPVAMARELSAAQLDQFGLVTKAERCAVNGKRSHRLAQRNPVWPAQERHQRCRCWRKTSSASYRFRFSTVICARSSV